MLCIFCTLLSITCNRTLFCIFVLSIFYFALSISRSNSEPCHASLLYFAVHISYAMSMKGSTLHFSCYSGPDYVYLSFMVHFGMRISSAACYSCIFVSTKITPRWSAVLLCSFLSSKLLFHLCRLKMIFLSCNKSFIMVRWDALKQSRSIKCFQKVLKGVGLDWNIWSAVQGSVESKRDGW